MTQLHIHYDNDAGDIIVNVNAALAEHGLRFVDDGLEHDGFCVYNVEPSNTAHQRVIDICEQQGWELTIVARPDETVRGPIHAGRQNITIRGVDSK